MMIENFTPEQQNCPVTIHEKYIDEYFAVDSVNIIQETDVLDVSHPVSVKFE